MKHYLQLVRFEFDRFIKIYLALAVITIIGQLAVVMTKANQYVHLINTQIPRNYSSQTEFINDHGKFSFAMISDSLWFNASIAMCIISLLIYCFFIWYRDWLGKNTFAYRLLMLPTSRLNIYLAKATTIFLMVLGLVALQLILLPLEEQVIKFIVPVSFRADMSVLFMLAGSSVFQTLLPGTLPGFLLAYGTGFMSVFVLFTIILIERSYHWKGIVFGILYGIIMIGIFLAPYTLELLLNNDYLYPIEFVLTEISLGVLVSALSISLSAYLLNKKITV